MVEMLQLPRKFLVLSFGVIEVLMQQLDEF